MKDKDQFFSFVEFLLGNGRRINTWKENWCGTEYLAIKFPDIYSITIKKGVSIADCWDCEHQAWDLGIRRPLFN